MEDGTGAYLIAGGGPKSNARDTIALFARALSGIGIAAPHVAYIGTATQDNVAFFHMLEPLMQQAGASDVALVPLASADADVSLARSMLDSCDIVFISGGEPADGMYWLHRHNLEGYLRNLFTAGKPFFGLSAGSIMMGGHWFSPDHPDDLTAPHPDPSGPAPDAANTHLIECLGFTPANFDAHAEDADWPDLRLMLQLSGAGSSGFGLTREVVTYLSRQGSLVDISGKRIELRNIDGMIQTV